jgi:hypothetical protein
MQALRSQTIFADPLSFVYRNEMQLGEALAMADAAVRGWKEFVRLDPGNTIAWGNMLVGYRVKNETQQLMGRPGDAAATLWSSLDVDRGAPPSARVRGNLSVAAGLLAILEANRGNTKQAADALALHAKFIKQLEGDTTASKFDRALRPSAHDYWRALVAQAAGDDGRAIEIGHAVLPKLEQIKTADEAERRTKSNILRGIHWSMAQSAYALKDYPAAHRAMTQIDELRRLEPWEAVSDKREIAFEQAFTALTLARLDRQADAQRLVGPALKFERELSPRNRDDPSQRFELAIALYVASVAGSGDAQAQLREATTILDNLPAEMRQLRDMTLWRERVADEQKKRR